MPKYQVTMRNTAPGPDGLNWLHEATDYVEQEDLEAYVLDAQKRWLGGVFVSENPIDGTP